MPQMRGGPIRKCGVALLAASRVVGLVALVLAVSSLDSSRPATAHSGVSIALAAASVDDTPDQLVVKFHEATAPGDATAKQLERAVSDIVAAYQ